MVGVAALGVNVAYAHVVYGRADTYVSDPAPCVNNYAEMSDGSGYGYAKADVRSWQKFWGTNLTCSVHFDRPQSNIRVTYQVLHRVSGEDWTICNSPSFKYNGSITWKLSKSRTFSSSSWCGPGDYGTWNIGHVKNGSWYGGTVWSGTHSLP